MVIEERKGKMESQGRHGDKPLGKSGGGHGLMGAWGDGWSKVIVRVPSGLRADGDGIGQRNE